MCLKRRADLVAGPFCSLRRQIKFMVRWTASPLRLSLLAIARPTLLCEECRTARHSTFILLTDAERAQPVNMYGIMHVFITWRRLYFECCASPARASLGRRIRAGSRTFFTRF